MIQLICFLRIPRHTASLDKGTETWQTLLPLSHVPADVAMDNRDKNAFMVKISMKY
ncbi:hypothetical protein GbCGDNIH7_8370 [Granulibacter bethesdensis]|nr:hypothetical protein GbCGDNIH7_8370 [Granulibacter bethesdensis]